MPSRRKSEKHRSGSDKPSMKLARRARSFKDDVMDRINNMRVSPGGATLRSPSPTKHVKTSPLGGVACMETNLQKDDKEMDKLYLCKKDVLYALKYFQDVIEKSMMQLLPGSATIVLETVTAVFSVLGHTNDDSSVIISSHNQVFQSIAQFIHFADHMLLHDEVPADRERANQVIRGVRDAIVNLVQLHADRIQDRSTQREPPLELPEVGGMRSKEPESDSNTSFNTVVPLTEREEEILRETRRLGEESLPPPKPPLHPKTSPRVSMRERSPTEVAAAVITGGNPPLPPKRRLSGSYSSCDELLGTALQPDDVAFPRAQSPDVIYSRAQSPDVIYPRAQSPDVVSPCDQSPDVVFPRAQSPDVVFPRAQSPDVFHPVAAGSLLEQLQNGQLRHRLRGDAFGGARPASGHVTGSLFSDPFWTNSSCLGERSFARRGAPDTGSDHSSAEDVLAAIPASDSVVVAGGNGATTTTTRRVGMTMERTTVIKSTKTHVTVSQGVQRVSVAAGAAAAVENSVVVGQGVQRVTAGVQRVTVAGMQDDGVVVGDGDGVRRATSAGVVDNCVTVGQWRATDAGAGDGSWGMPRLTALDNGVAATGGTEVAAATEASPPALPDKRRRPSHYDNVPAAAGAANGATSVATRGLVTQTLLVSQSGDGGAPVVHAQRTRTLTVERDGRVVTQYSSREDGAPDADAAAGSEPAPPPLPIKKRNIMAYMQMVGDYAVPNRDELLQLNWRTSHSLMRHIAATPALQQLQPPRWPAWSSHSLPPLMTSSSDDSGMFSLDLSLPEDDAPPPALPPKQRHLAIEEGRAEELAAREAEREHGEERTKEAGGKEGVAEEEPEGEAADAAATHALEALDPGLYLVWKKEREEGPDVRGGTVDGLIVLAACRAKNQNDFLYQEAFLTTYRTFMGSRPLIDKLLHRYRAFSRCADTGRKRSSRSAFSLLVRVVDELCVTDVDDSLVKILTDLVFELLSDGQLLLGKVLRSRILEKCETKRESSNHHMLLLPSIAVSSRPVTLLDYKPEHIAEQMTMLDASLFQKMEIAEMLLWAKEQSEELSPNLTLFTEHFNKMSYWARSRILEQDDARDRERHLVRFIKIMKHLRRLNNFNSYLALLSALDSAPIRRLDWVKQITETLKEYCELIDSSASFRAYRLALAETEPPCIPYIGLILQDLTFVHIGNSDLLPDGKINFAKRWQQFNILDNMRKFRMCNYPIKKNERILAFFNGFSDYLDEETMWQISESIKPRGGRSKQTHM